MDYNYLVPANSKKQGLIFGFMKKEDLIILSIGLGLTFLLFAITRATTLLLGILTLIPALVAAFLVFHGSRRRASLRPCSQAPRGVATTTESANLGAGTHPGCKAV
jgi:hypothetical protein